MYIVASGVASGDSANCNSVKAGVMKALHFFATSWFVTFLGLASFFFAAEPQSRGDRQINGQVVVADGTPVGGATVATTQDCFHFGDNIETRSTVSAADGTFS